MFRVHTFKTITLGIGVIAGLFFAGLACLPSYAAPQQPGLFLVRLEVQGTSHETVSVSAPLALLHTIFDILPQELRDDAEKSGVKLDDLVKEFEGLESQDLVKVEHDNEKVRIWIEPVSETDHDAMKVVKIHVEEGEGKHKVDVCLPSALVQVAGQLLKEYGVMDELIEQIPVLSEKIKAKHATTAGIHLHAENPHGNEGQSGETSNPEAQPNPVP